MADDKKKRNKKKKKTKRGGGKRKMTVEQASAFMSVSNWVFLDSSYSSSSPRPSSSSASSLDGFAVTITGDNKLVFELHSHSNFSDGFLSPSKLLERAHMNGVKVLALTDHDTMAGIPEAVETGCRFGIKIIPGVEISTMFRSRDSGYEEPVHILAYYGSCGPSMYNEMDEFLAKIRDGRFNRAREMVLKLNKLKIPLKWENVAKIAGKDVAPGRLHVARALFEGGYVENLKQAFTRYLYDGGPAYSTGSEPMAEEAVEIIRKTGGISVLAHPWALKNHAAVIRRLKDAGLQGIEVYRSDGKQDVFSDLADTYDLLKLGGSDFHGRGGRNESELGSVNLPVLALLDFLKVARPVWCDAIKAVLENFADHPSDSNLSNIVRFDRERILKGNSVLNFGNDLIDRCLSSWLTSEERQRPEFVAIKLKLSDVSIASTGLPVPVGCKCN
ncbi:PREDICTED: uncharacterized protein LOC104807167 [Tarenaya hassleriana]|uniref:uncharacterized protein LOC104807167 n=1 Tax=Tarenaya hassleriana TaxID=28532 RepID=UPI00053C3D0E|nr:PREDICTED: uncharacterized protein LOC104807167 [Tarenaya hassleriana]